MIELIPENSQEVSLKIEGKTTKGLSLDPPCYVFTDYTLAVILPRRGWSLVKKTKKRQYLSPPAGLTQPFRITIRVPTREYLRKLADEFFQKGESVIDQLGEWPLVYQHRKKNGLVESRINLATAEVHQFTPSEEPMSTLRVGHETWWLEIDIVGDTVSEYENARNIDFMFDRTPIPEDSSLEEGEACSVVENVYERNKEARIRCIHHYGAYCQICGFSFSKTYGMIGNGFIHVHHIVPISEIRKNYVVDPIRDLIPVCANCHAMIHRRQPVLSILELREIVERNRVRT